MTSLLKGTSCTVIVQHVPPFNVSKCTPNRTSEPDNYKGGIRENWTQAPEEKTRTSVEVCVDTMPVGARLIQRHSSGDERRGVVAAIANFAVEHCNTVGQGPRLKPVCDLASVTVAIAGTWASR